MRPDLNLVAALVGRDARVLDLGCGDGALLEQLITRQGCTGHGIERSIEGFHACIARGVPVSQGDLERELGELPSDAYDWAVLSLTLQAVRHPARVLVEMRRVAPRRIISLPNFGHWRLRAELALRGRMPSSRALPYSWHETPNIHLCTLRDFELLVAESDQVVERRVLLDGSGRPAGRTARLEPNLLATGAVYVLRDAAPTETVSSG